MFFYVEDLGGNTGYLEKIRFFYRRYTGEEARMIDCGRAGIAVFRMGSGKKKEKRLLCLGCACADVICGEMTDDYFRALFELYAPEEARARRYFAGETAALRMRAGNDLAAIQEDVCLRLRNGNRFCPEGYFRFVLRDRQKALCQQMIGAAFACLLRRWEEALRETQEGAETVTVDLVAGEKAVVATRGDRMFSVAVSELARTLGRISAGRIVLRRNGYRLADEVEKELERFPNLLFDKK